MSDTWSPSVGFSESAVAKSESFFSSFSDAATSLTRAESIAGSVTRETSSRVAEVICITPLLFVHSFI